MNTRVFYFLELAARWHVFVLLSIYGFGKLIGGQFYRKGSLPEEIAQIHLSEVGGFDLAWTFMGYSYSYILFIGCMQLIGAFLLLFNKTKLIETGILILILVNIIVFDAVFFDTYGALASAIIYFLLLLLILYFNKEKVISSIKILIEIDNNYKKENKSFSINLMTIGVVLGVMLLIFGVEQLLVNLLGH